MSADERSGTQDAKQDTAGLSDAVGDVVQERVSGDLRPPDGGAQVCVGPENTAPIVEETVVADPAPVPKGGAIQPGKYHLTAYVWFNGSMKPPEPGLIPSHQITAVIDENLKMSRAALNRATGETFADQYDIRMNDGTSVAMLYVCPDLAGGPFYEYDATPTNVSFYVNARFYQMEKDGGYVMVFTKQ